MSHGMVGACTSSNSMPVLMGLLVHAAADGLAVGVAHVSPSMKLAVAVGMAMVLHKGPVALGLGSYLVSQKCSTAVVIQVTLLAPLTETISLLSRGQRRFLSFASVSGWPGALFANT
jgi:solute carrier family 39 (zinc transporter), member 9